MRPEKIHVHSGGRTEPADQNVVPATLRSAVFAGVSFQYFFQTSEGREMTAFDRNSSGGAVAKPGDAVRLAWAPEHTFVIPVGDAAAQAPPQPHVRGEE